MKNAIVSRTESLSFCFIHKVPGARCWDENLTAASSLVVVPERELSPCLLKQKPPLIVCPSLLLPVSLSFHPPAPSYSLWLFPVNWLLDLPLNLRLILFNPVYNIQAESS